MAWHGNWTTTDLGDRAAGNDPGDRRLATLGKHLGLGLNGIAGDLATGCFWVFGGLGAGAATAAGQSGGDRGVGDRGQLITAEPIGGEVATVACDWLGSKFRFGDPIDLCGRVRDTATDLA